MRGGAVVVYRVSLSLDVPPSTNTFIERNKFVSYSEVWPRMHTHACTQTEILTHTHTSTHSPIHNQASKQTHTFACMQLHAQHIIYIAVRIKLLYFYVSKSIIT